ncbi:MAG: hypothetical protein WD768_18510 [Phycisphaeraceae bacterium]
MASGEGSSSLLLDEYFANQDSRFLETLRAIRGHKRLAAFADRWKKDSRPWAKEQIFAYLAQPLDCLDHQPLVKHLFKHAEEQRDDELMGAFLRAFDRLVRFERRTRHRYNWQTRESWTEESLYLPRNTMPLESTREYKDWRGRPYTVPVRVPRGAKLFSLRTRYYLRRRAWRYFRRMGFGRPQDYVAAIAGALEHFNDDVLSAGEHILESWGLVHACFFRHEALQFNATRCHLKEGRSIGELSPAPYFEDLWKEQAACGTLMSLLSDAGSRLVRIWTIQMLRAHHADRLKNLPPEELVKLLDHSDGDVQQFGAELLENLADIEKLTIETWLRLLKTTNDGALASICELMGKHVMVSRLDLADCLALARSESTPIARMGLGFLKQRTIATGPDREAIAALADGKCAATGLEAAAWALAILGNDDAYDIDGVIRFFDSLLVTTRQGAWDWLLSTPAGKPTRGHGDPQLWSRLLETPFDDVRLKIVDLLEHRAVGAKMQGRDVDTASLLGAPNVDLTAVWAAVLLSVHRGGRQKAKALRQISDAVSRDPSKAAALLPILAVALRSVRPAEVRPALAAIVSAVEKHPPLTEAVAKHLPELQLAPSLAGGAA